MNYWTVQSDEDRAALHSIRTTLRDCGVECDVSPPYEAPIPVRNRSIVFGETNEGRYPYEMHLMADRVEIVDEAGDPVAMAGLEPDQRIAGCVALALEVVGK